MADRKGRTATFKLPRKLNAGLIKTAFEKDLSSKVTVFQDLGSGEFWLNCHRRMLRNLLSRMVLMWTMSMFFVIPRMVLLQMLVSWVLDCTLKIVKLKRHYQISVRLRVQLSD